MLVRFVKLISGVITVSMHIWLSMVRLFRPLGAGVRDSAGVACEKMVFSLPGALAVSLAGIGVLVSLCVSAEDGWYSLTVLTSDGSESPSSSITYSVLLLFGVMPLLACVTLPRKPLLRVMIDDDVDALLGALRLGGSDCTPGGACTDWRSDWPILSDSSSLMVNCLG
ncbi:hypothetical protein PENFLA_c078G10212 [Penicillium flavigenum]|uniref:Uncharacterized protein n=1 Tax=Penicillium flavigenum TaxID=254877 RepID=A0A1V6SAX3_9EURO|nr:hypothetical protein PENFLA_c078G10212 [Penicillium flavigenum]